MYLINARLQVERLILRVRKSPFASSMAVLSGTSAVAALVALGATPFISRLYTPAEYGVLGVFAAALSIVSVVATLRYDFAIPAAHDDEEAATLLIVALCVVVATSLLCAALVLLGVLGRLMPAARDSTAILVWALPLGMAAIGTYNTLSSWMVRRLNYATLGKTKIAQVIAMVSAQVGLGVLKAGAVGLIIGQIAASSTGIVRLAREVIKHDRSAFSKVQTPRMRATAWHFRRFPMLSGPAVLFDALSGALPLLALASRFGATSAGVYTIVQRVLLAPLALLTINLGQVIFGDLAMLQRANSASMMAVFNRRLRQIVLLGIAITVIMLIAVPLVLPTILGPQWGDATRYFLILLPMLFAGFVAAPFGIAVDVLRRQDLHLLRDSLRVGVFIVLLGIAQAEGFGPTATLAMISAAGCVNGVIYLGISWYAISCVHQPVNIAKSLDITVPPLD